jgi:mono/diheme cytochrome c family protein
MRVLVLLLLFVLAGCDESMDSQNRTKTYGSAAGLPSWPSWGEAVPLVEGTVAQGDLDRQQALAHPPKVSRALLDRGRERYDIYCAPCHGLTGAGDGFIVERGFPTPKSFDDPQVMTASAADLRDIISHGKGTMYGFSDRVAPADRWAIVAYMRALQLASSTRRPPS